MDLAKALVGMTLIVSTLAHAEDQSKPSAAAEQERIQRLYNSKTMTEAFDNMTPAEIAELMGFPESMDLLQLTNSAKPLVKISVDITTQKMWINTFDAVTGKYTEQPVFSATVSTGDSDSGYTTQQGCHTVKWTSKMHYSRKYNNSPMPFSVFYYDGFALHGTGDLGNLGWEASHGCVRLHPNHAKEVYNYVLMAGKENSQVCVFGQTGTRSKRAQRIAKGGGQRRATQRQASPR